MEFERHRRCQHQPPPPLQLLRAVLRCGMTVALHQRQLHPAGHAYPACSMQQVRYQRFPVPAVVLCVQAASPRMHWNSQRSRRTLLH